MMTLEELRGNQAIIDEIDWNMTPEEAVRLYLEWGNNWARGNYVIRSKADVSHYFVVNTWETEPRLFLVRRNSEDCEELAEIEATDVGKPLAQARNDAIALARYMEFYGGAADKLMGETIPFQNGFTVYTLREPHGVTGHIVPWNYPMQIIGRSVGAALAMGNTLVVKPAEDASLSTVRVAELALEAGCPPGVFNVVNTAEDPDTIAKGNDRVLRARLADAQFFVEEDLKAPLADRLKPGLRTLDPGPPGISYGFFRTSAGVED